MRIGNYLPDFCNTDVFFRVVLVTELVAIIFALISYPGDDFYIHLAMISILMQWIGLMSAGLLCLLSRWGLIRNILATTIITFAVGLSITLAVTLLSQTVVDMTIMTPGASNITYDLLRNLSIATILIGLSLRYFYVQHDSKIVLEAQAKARLQMLQARIRPHFLFNSMNTIASLIHDQPDLAEQATEDLSDLFRASLAAEDSVSLQQEIELTRSYLQLEVLRLGDRLKIIWDLPKDDIQLMLPALTLQPLVENAVYHGIEPLSEGGIINIRVRTIEDRISIMISNPLLEDRTEQHRKGNQMAVDNIYERLQITYDGQATMSQIEENSQFTVTLLFPIIS